MTPTGSQLFLRDVAFWLGAIAPLFFAVQYTLIATWWHNPTGRAIMALDACIFFTVAPKALYLAWPHATDGVTDVLLWVNVIALLGVPLVILYRMYAFEVMRRRYRREVPLRLLPGGAGPYAVPKCQDRRSDLREVP